MEHKKHPEIACCGIDCALCPRYYTAGGSRCPGCFAKGFNLKHPSCSIITCCCKKHKFETCAECPEFLCSKIRDWDKGDSFVTHKRAISNLNEIKKNGIHNYLSSQKQRTSTLKKLLDEYDDGKSKSFYCLAAALLTIDGLDKINKTISDNRFVDENSDLKGQASAIREIMNRVAIDDGVELKYRK